MRPNSYNASSMLRSDYGQLERVGGPESVVFRGRGNDGGFVALRFFQTDDPTVRTAAAEIVHAASRIRHPMLAAVGGCQNFSGDAIAIVSEYVPGQPLDRWVQEHGLPSLRMTIDVVRRLSLGLHAAHQRLLTHGALHPGNIMVMQPDTRPGGRIVAKLLDVGVPTWLRSWPPHAAAARYVAPELLHAGTPSAPQPLDGARTDVFACGGLLHYLCTGEPPFGNATLSQLMAANTTPPKPRPSWINPEIPPELEQVILRALAFEPSDRLENAGELANVLGYVESLFDNSSIRNVGGAFFTTNGLPRRVTSPDAETPVIHVRGRGTSGSQPGLGKREFSVSLPRGVAGLHPGTNPTGTTNLSNLTSSTSSRNIHVHPQQAPAPSGTYPKVTWPPKPRASSSLALAALCTLLVFFVAYLGSNATDPTTQHASAVARGQLEQTTRNAATTREAQGSIRSRPTDDDVARSPAFTIAAGSPHTLPPATADEHEVQPRGYGRPDRARDSKSHGATREKNARVERESELLGVEPRLAEADAAADLAPASKRARAQQRSDLIHTDRQEIEVLPDEAASRRTSSTQRSLSAASESTHEASASHTAMTAQDESTASNLAAKPAARARASSAPRTGTDEANPPQREKPATEREAGGKASPLRVADVRVRGSLSPSVLRRALERIRPQLARCVQEHAAPAGDGHVELQLSATIDEIGRARSATVSGSARAALNDCLSAATSRLVSDAPDTGTVKVSWTLAY
jgi:serine/threonine protein kinase